MVASDPRSLWLSQLRLEGKELDADGRLVRLPGVEPDPIPDCAVTRFADHDELTFSSTGSVRSDDESAELWVHTDPEHQRRGYASRAATAWAAAVTGSGRTAFYSHLAANEPSRRLARSLGVTHLFELAALTAERRS